jgi:hypothetical protein
MPAACFTFRQTDPVSNQRIATRAAGRRGPGRCGRVDAQFSGRSGVTHAADYRTFPDGGTATDGLEALANATLAPLRALR